MKIIKIIILLLFITISKGNQNDDNFEITTEITNDEGCLIHVYLDYNSHYVSMIYKLKSEDFEIITDVSVSGEDFEPVIYPNPVSSILNVNVGNMHGSNVTVTIVDMIGRRYLDKEVFINGNTLTLDVSSLSEGTYFYSLLIDGRYVLTEKFVKK